MRKLLNVMMVAILSVVVVSGVFTAGGCRRGGDDGGIGVTNSDTVAATDPGSGDGGSGEADPGAVTDPGSSANLSTGSNADGGTGAGASSPGTLTSISVTPVNPSMAKGTSLQFTATGSYSDSTTRDITALITWSSADEGIATISVDGLVNSVAAGTTTITAAYGTVAGHCALTVTGASLVSISVTPANQQIAKGTKQQFAATGTFTDNSTQDLTTQVSWSSSDTAKATITDAGMATGTGVGSTTITAVTGSISASATLTVTSATLSSLAISPANAKIALGTTQQFTATGTFTDNSTQDLTAQATWSSSDMSKASVSNSTGMKGLASSVAAGSAVITVSFGGKSATTSLSVTAASLVSIGITPSVVSVPLGLTQQLVATGYYSDNSTQDLTGLVTWLTSNSAVASIGNTNLLRGLATSLLPGSTIITAIDPVTKVVSSAVTITVTSAVLKSISVSPGIVSTALGLAQQFVAIGTYSDGTTETITNAVTWLTSNDVVASISNTELVKGLACTLHAGTTSITAIDPVTKIASVSVDFTVTSAVLKSISVTPGIVSTALGLTHQFHATGCYTDNSTQDLTGLVTWLSSNGAVAGISNTSLLKGLASTLLIGSTSITALDPVTKIVSSPVTLNVTNAVLQSIAVTPGSLLSKALGLTQQLTAIGTYSDGTTQTLTNAVTWLSSNGVVASISNSDSLKGLVSTLLVGSTSITALDPITKIVSAPVVFNVTSAILKAISISPLSPSILLGLTQQFTAVGTYTDGSTQTITNAVTWLSSNGLVASISNLLSSKGLATGLLLGSTSISAIDPVTQIASPVANLSILASLLNGIGGLLGGLL